MKNEVYVTADNTVAKYVHEDGVETSIKTWPEGVISCGGSNRNKFNVFASCSLGCPIRCTFCYLTAKNFSYSLIPPKDITSNVVNAVLQELERRPELKRKPMNLSWMGMGDAFFNMHHTYMNSISILRRLSKDVIAFEGVDIATTLPIISYDDVSILSDIHNTLLSTSKLTEKDNNRTHLRLFYSLHSLNNKVRKVLIPRTIDLNVSLPYLDNLSATYNVIYHYMFLDGINDQDNDIEQLLQFGSNHNIRILRFNQCPNTKYKESEKFNEIIEHLNKRIEIKVQLSPGSEVSAACGMFLMSTK